MICNSSDKLYELEELWYPYEGKGPVATFFPEVIKVIKLEGSDGSKDTALIRLHFRDGSYTEKEISTTGIERIDWSSLDDRCVVCQRNKVAKKYITDIIRLGMIPAPKKRRLYFNKLGIHHINGHTCFFAGNMLYVKSSEQNDIPEFAGDSLFHLDIDPQISTIEAIGGMIELINLSPESGRIIVAFTIAAITRAAFVEAGFIPRTVLVIVGKTGMLKTHYVPQVAQIYNRADKIAPVTRFNSTKRFIEDELYRYSECTAVIDDLHTAESNSIRKGNEETAEEIIRRVSDNTGRGRKEGAISVQREFTGNVIFIGEYMIGKASTIPRALVVPLKTPIDGAVLDKFQRKNPLLVSNFYALFIQWYVDNYDEILTDIGENLTDFRRNSAKFPTHGRLMDSTFNLQVSYRLFLLFLRENGMCSDNDFQEESDNFATSLNELIQKQQERLKNDEGAEDVNYILLLRNLYESNRFRIASNVKEFDSKKYDGILHYDCLCLRGESIDRELGKVLAVFSRSACAKALKREGALKIVPNTNKYTVQIDGCKGLRFYAILCKKLFQ